MSINEFLKEEVLDIIKIDDNWAIETLPYTCGVCNLLFETEIPFNIYKNVGNDIWAISFHYECSFKEEEDYDFTLDGVIE